MFLLHEKALWEPSQDAERERLCLGLESLFDLSRATQHSATPGKGKRDSSVICHELK